MSSEIDVLALSLMARVYACNARVEAMKAENVRWSILHPDNSPIYTEQDFDAVVRRNILRGKWLWDGRT